MKIASLLHEQNVCCLQISLMYKRCHFFLTYPHYTDIGPAFSSTDLTQWGFPNSCWGQTCTLRTWREVSSSHVWKVFWGHGEVLRHKKVRTLSECDWKTLPVVSREYSWPTWHIKESTGKGKKLNFLIKMSQQKSGYVCQLLASQYWDKAINVHPKEM